MCSNDDGDSTSRSNNNVNQLKMGHSSSRESRSFYSFKPYQFVQCHPNKNISKCKPKPRSGHRIVCDDINLYSYGGYNPDVPLDDPVMQNDEDWENYRPLFHEVWKFNLALQTWTKLNCGEIPDVLASNAVTLSGNVLMVFGGTGVPFGAHCSNDLFICDLSKKGDLSFTLIDTSGDMPSPKYGQAIVLDNEFLYTVGGTAGYEFSCDIHRLDLRTKTWDEIFENKGRLEEPPGRYRHELAFNGSKIFVLGGGTAETAYGFEEICSFNLKKNKWEKFVTVQDEKHGYPSARRCHSSVQFKDEVSGKLFVYIICGYNNTFICKDIWRLDLTTLQWTKLKDTYPMPIYFHSSAITPNGKVYTFGGIVKHSNCVRTDDVYSMWITIPKLKEICWEAFLYYNPRLQSTPKLDLINSGIPHEYIRRLDTDSK